jgi:hypothetical protein
MIPPDVVGKILFVRYWDHVSGHSGPLKCATVGIVEKVTPEAIEIAWWQIEDEEDETLKSSTALLTIVQGGVVEWLELAPAKLKRRGPDQRYLPHGPQ